MNQKKKSTRLEDQPLGKIVICILGFMPLLIIGLLALIGTRLFDGLSRNLLWLCVMFASSFIFVIFWVIQTTRDGYRPPTRKEISESWSAWPGLFFAIPTAFISLDGTLASVPDIAVASLLIILSMIFPSIRPRRVLDESKPATADTEAAKKPTDTETEKQPTGADPKN